jgi:hypothetical protein
MKNTATLNVLRDKMHPPGVTDAFLESYAQIYAENRVKL